MEAHARAEVERLVRLHDDQRHAAERTHEPLQPVEASPTVPFSLDSSAHLEASGRAAVAATLAALLFHLVYRHDFSYVVVVAAILCSSPTFGATLRTAMHATVAMVAMCPTSFLALAVARRTAPAEVHHSVAVGTHALLMLLVMCAVELPPVARKCLLAFGAAGVLGALSAPDREGEILLGVSGAVVRGAACALVGATLPYPRMATRRADIALHASAAGVVLLFEAMVAGLTWRAGGGQQPSRLHVERVQAATAEQLELLPPLLADARWEPSMHWRRKVEWRASQLAALVSLHQDLAVLTDALRVVDSLNSSSLAARLIQSLERELSGFSGAARAFAVAVAGTRLPPADDCARVAAHCKDALGTFDEAFLRARLALVFSTRDGDGSGAPHPAEDHRHLRGENEDDAASRAAARDISTVWIGEVVAAEALFFACCRFVECLRRTASSPSSSSSPPGASAPVAAVVDVATSRNGEEPRSCRACGRWAAAAMSLRAKDAARAACALLVAELLAVNFAKGFWAAVTVAMVLEPGLGASVRNALGRLLGSVIGAFFGLFALRLSAPLEGGAARDALLLVAFAVWVCGCSFVRAASTANSYAGFVAAFTASIMLLGPACGLGSRSGGGGSAVQGASVADQGVAGQEEVAVGTCSQGSLAADVDTWAIERIQFTLAGIVLAMLAAATVFPVDAPRQCHEKLGECLEDMRCLFNHTAAEWVAKSAAPSPRAHTHPPRWHESSAAREVPREVVSISAVPDAVAAAQGLELQGGLGLQPVNVVVVEDAPPSAASVATTTRTNVDTRPPPPLATAADDDEARGSELRRRVLAALAALPALAEEATHGGGCWRHPFPSAAVVAVCAALRGMLEALDLMHTTLTALQPGEATSLIEPLLQPLNRVEAQVAHSLRAILQRLRAGSATHGASLFDLRHMQRPLALMPSTLRLFEDCYAECLRGIVAANRRALSSMATNAPSLSNNEVLTFNALVYSIKALIHHMGCCYERLEVMLAVQRPIDLRSIKFV